MKVKSLREIETIRESKKRDMINSVIGAEIGSNCPTLNVMPGHMIFTDPFKVINDH